MLEVNDIREKTLKSKKNEIDRLLSRKYPVFLMGINETTDQVIALLNKYDITIEGILDDFSKEKKYKGIEIFSSDKIMMQKTTAIILLAVNVRPKTAEYNLRQKGFRHLLHSFELFLYDNIENIVLPFWQNGYKDFKLNKEKYFWLYSNLNDDMSKKVLVDTLNFRINANLSVMKDYDININNQYFEEFLNFSKRESFVDCGGYDGETTKRFIELNPLYEKIFYFEPINSFFELSKQKLNAYKNIVFFQRANYKENKILSFNINGENSSCDPNGKNDIAAVSLDSVLHDPVTFIKMDIEGAEYDALLGAQRIIKKHKPKMAICIYHNQEHFWKVPELVLSLNPEYKIYIRHYTEGLRETVMYFV